MSDLDPQHLRLLEAILFSSADPLPEKTLANRLPDGADLKGLLKALGEHYAHRGVNLVHAGGSWAFRTAPDLGGMLARDAEVTRKLGRATVETLAIVAYHQPVTRAEIEEIRGVGLSKGTLDILLEAGWVKPRGRRDTPGRPMTWGTTDAFLDHFGLESVKDLPGVEELKAAGLLDKRPAIEAYSTRGTLTQAGEGEDLQEEEAEPLDPDDDLLEPDLLDQVAED